MAESEITQKFAPFFGLVRSRSQTTQITNKFIGGYRLRGLHFLPDPLTRAYERCSQDDIRMYVENLQKWSQYS